MSEEQKRDTHFSIPQVDYFGKAIDQIGSYDSLLASLYSALIAGVVSYCQILWMRAGA